VFWQSQINNICLWAESSCEDGSARRVRRRVRPQVPQVPFIQKQPDKDHKAAIAF
jgi:hypothetical protein